MRKLLITYLYLWHVFLHAQQDPQYSQYMFNQVILNPAYIGSKEALNATLMYRKQWVEISGAPQTINLSVSGPLKQKRLGLGGHVVQESIGPKTWLSAYLDYSYKVRLGRGHLAFGLSTGLVNYHFNASRLNLQDPSEPLQAYNFSNINRFDMNAGLYYHSSSFYAGLSMSHLTSPRLFDINTPTGTQAYYNLKPHVFVTLGKGFAVSENLVFSPSVLVKIVEGQQVNADLNFNFLIRERLWLGVSFRSSNAMVALAQFRITDKIKLGYSYDQGVTGVMRAAGGSHEVMIGYDFYKFKSKTISTRYL